MIFAMSNIPLKTNAPLEQKYRGISVLLLMDWRWFVTRRD